MSSDPRLVVRNHAHLESHPIDSDRVGTPGASGFAHLRVGGFATQGVLLAPKTSRCEKLRAPGIASD